MSMLKILLKAQTNINRFLFLYLIPTKVKEVSSICTKYKISTQLRNGQEKSYLKHKKSQG